MAILIHYRLYHHHNYWVLRISCVFQVSWWIWWYSSSFFCFIFFFSFFFSFFIFIFIFIIFFIILFLFIECQKGIVQYSLLSYPSLPTLSFSSSAIPTSYFLVHTGRLWLVRSLQNYIMWTIFGGLLSAWQFWLETSKPSNTCSQRVSVACTLVICIWINRTLASYEVPNNTVLQLQNSVK